MDPTEYTSADAYAEHVANNLPDLSEVSAAALALIKAIRKLEGNSLIASIKPLEKMAEWLAIEIDDYFEIENDERFDGYAEEQWTKALWMEKDSWIKAIEREEADAKLTQPTIDLAGMVMGILGGKS